jgi:hypothetical protein
MTTTIKHKKDATGDPAKLGHRTCMLGGSPCVADMIDAIDCGHTFIVEQTTLCPGISPLGQFHIRLSSKTCYQLDLVGVLDYFLLHKTNLHPVVCEQILTTTHECIMNALLWNNLQIPPTEKPTKGLDFDSVIQERLQDLEAASRPLDVIVTIQDTIVQITIKSSAGGFNLEEALTKVKSPCQGLSVIKSFTDEFISEDEGRTLHLRFSV